MALAGTRQQSRLIAMMQDFDRTLELVDTSASSHGATLAQQAKYMDGMAAKITLLKNAYEGFVQSLTNNKLIIGGIETITKFLEFAADISGVLVPVAIALVGYGAVQLVQKQKIKQLEFEIEKFQTQQALSAAQKTLEEKKQTLEEDKQAEKARTTLALEKVAQAQKEKELAIEEEQTKQQEIQNLLKKQEQAIASGNDAEATAIQAQITAAEAQLKTLKLTTAEKEVALKQAREEATLAKANEGAAEAELKEQEVLVGKLQLQLQNLTFSIRNIGSIISTLGKLGQSGGLATIGKSLLSAGKGLLTFLQAA